jgi:hypothetical protein
MNKTFTLWFARRTPDSIGPDFEYKEITATSQKEAKRIGKSMEHPDTTDDRVWFRGLVPNRVAT